jgi:hypothetical protein
MTNNKSRIHKKWGKEIKKCQNGTVLWIRNFLLQFRIRIRLLKEFRIQIRLLKSYESGFGFDPNYLLFLQNYDF